MPQVHCLQNDIALNLLLKHKKIQYPPFYYHGGVMFAEVKIKICQR